MGLLHLPYFWDEAGYYVPAARDLLLTGSLIPHSTPSNAHPPLVMAYLALCWKFFGFSTLVTRVAMLAAAAFALLGIFRLARLVSNTSVAIAATACTALYPVFFVQSSLAQVDLAAAGLTFWGLAAYIQHRRAAMVVWFSLAVLAKETAVLTPLALLAWELLHAYLQRQNGKPTKIRLSKIPLLCVPIIPLVCWYAFHYARMGYVFGNPAFFRYNVANTLHPLRIVLALLMRLWQVFGYFNLWILTAAAALAMFRPPVSDAGRPRERISLETQFAFLAVVIAYVAVMAFVGGAVLARYMLPAVPLVIIVFVSTIWRRVRLWEFVLALVVFAFAAGLSINPPYGFSFEDNLAYRDYVVLHQQAEAFLQARYPSASVLTAWPATDELAHPYLGYVRAPMRVIPLNDFTAAQLTSAGDGAASFDVALVFSTKYEPPHPLLDRFQRWRSIKTRFFDYHRDVPLPVAAEILGGRLIFSERRHGQWIGIIEMERIQRAVADPRPCGSGSSTPTGRAQLGCGAPQFTPPSDGTSASSQSAILPFPAEDAGNPSQPGSNEPQNPLRNSPSLSQSRPVAPAT